jgi:hypothetical protein
MKLKYLILIMFLVSQLNASKAYNQFKKSLKAQNYDKVMTIYSEQLYAKDLGNYQNLIYKNIISLMGNDRDNARELLYAFLDVAYQDSFGLFLKAKIELLDENYFNAIEILYNLKSYYLDSDFLIKVEQLFNVTINKYQNKIKKDKIKLEELLQLCETNGDDEQYTKIETLLKKLTKPKKIEKPKKEQKN